MALSLDENHTNIANTITFVLVKYLVLIPMLAVLLSNVPVIIELKMPAEEVEQCFMEEASSDCNEKAEEMKCCKTSESTCCYASCFQVLAPLQQVSKVRFSELQEQPSFNLYRQSLWQDPFLDGLMQPPDFV